MGVVELPAESKTAVSLCPEVLAHTETERPRQISLHRPLSPPDRCDLEAGYGAVVGKTN